ncbi:hypothetical protein [Brevibacillus choshinensis]|uniref:hypothetical protein n=1 Tax=Brevibacillus choshinensis TaxID=54911 RepID=UPI002E210D6A|nr:hypothetical protein [Brevibacillus choshinensis]
MQLDQFPGFKHFLECYFNISTDFSDLKNLALDYKNRESKNSVNALVVELHTISSMKDLEAVKTFVKKHGMRRLNDAKIKEMLRILLEDLT